MSDSKEYRKNYRRDTLLKNTKPKRRMRKIEKSLHVSILSDAGRERNYI